MREASKIASGSCPEERRRKVSKPPSPEKRTCNIAIQGLVTPISAQVAVAGAVHQRMTGMVADRIRDVVMDAFVAAAGAIVQRMARMIGDWVVRCPHAVGRSIR